MSYANIAILAADGQTTYNAGRQLEIGNWKSETGNWQAQFLISSFQFPVASFHFPFSIFQFPVPFSAQCPTNRRLWAEFLALIGVLGVEKPVRF
jgi:hypothetical protein